jgi:uncharacterized protein YndB with AHSA1/START domain
MMSAMDFRTELSYDASPDEVFAMLSDPAFREQVAEAQDVVSVDVRLTPSAEGFSLVSEQVQDTKDLPAIAKKIAGDTTRVVIEEEWGSHTKGAIAVTAPGKPTSATGTITLAPDGDGTVEIVELDIKVRVPLIGGKLEKLMAETIESGFQVEHTVGRAWLQDSRS